MMMIMIIGIIFVLNLCDTIVGPTQRVVQADSAQNNWPVQADGEVHPSCWKLWGNPGKILGESAGIQLEWGLLSGSRCA